MSHDCIITLWTIDVTVSGEIAISASPPVMDFSLIAERGENGKRSILLNFPALKKKRRKKKKQTTMI